jgi:hypothetical protein
MCLKCLTYMNLYATYDENSGLWTCPLCQGANAAPKELFGGSSSMLSPALVSPMVEYRQTLTESDAANSSATTIASYIVVMDANLPQHEAHAVATAMEEMLLQEVHADNGRNSKVQLALIVFDKTVSVYQLGISAGLASADVIQVGENDEDQDDLVRRRSGMPSRLYFTEVHTQSDLATFGCCVSAVFGLPAPPSEDEAHRLSRKEMLKRKKEARQQASNGTASTAQKKTESPWIQKETANRPPRCTGQAVQCAIDVAAFSSPTSRTSRILLFTNGCPNLGSGNIVRMDSRVRKRVAVDVIDNIAMMEAVNFFEATGKDASDENRIGIDVFLSGAGSLGLQAYQALVDPSGGYALPHDSFASPQFKFNLEYLLSQTFVARSASDDPSAMNDIDGCVVDVRMSDFLSPSHVVGAMEVIDAIKEAVLPNERATFATGASLAAKHGIATNNLPSQAHVDETLTRVRMGRYDPLSTLSFMLRVDENIKPEDKYAFFQCTIRYLEQDGKTLVTKVSTHRLPIARSVHDFLDSMDEEVVPIVLGKEAVFRSIVGREDEEAIDVLVADTDRVEMLAIEAQKDLDNTIHRVSGAYRLIGLQLGTSHRDFLEEGGVSSAHSSLGFAFPPELADALHRLFHLRRGSMLSPGPVRSMDDRAEIRNLFLRLPLDDCLCMMAPSLWSPGTIGRPFSTMLDPIPSDTMTLWDNVSTLCARYLFVSVE